MKEEQSPIQKKLMRLVLVTLGVVLLLTCLGFFSYEFFTYRQASKERLSTLGEIVASNSTAALAFENTDDANEMLNALKAEKHIVAAALYDKNGHLFAWYPEKIAKYNLPVHPAGDGFAYANSALQGFLPVIEGDKRLGTLYLQSDMQAIYHRFARYGMIALLVITLSVFVAYRLSQKLQKTISEPILALAKTARNISQKNDYTVRAKKFDEDELGVLTDAFNQMLTQIEKQNAEIMSFNHELEMKVNERTNELEQANVELRLKSEFVETIIDSSVDIIAVFDKEYKYVILNKSGREILGLKGNSVIGTNLLELYPQLKSSVMYQQLQQTFEKGEMILDQYYTSHVSDRVLQNFFIPLFDKDGQVDRVMVLGHDITEIDRAHEKLKVLNQQLEKSNQDLEQFAFVASHDLQEPLRKIQTFSQLLEYKLDDKEAVKKYLAKIIDAASRMTELIVAVLNYSRLSNEKGNFETVDLNEVVENVRNDLELKIAEKAAVIQTDQLPVIRGNRLQLTQLFLNLVGNSIKFSRKAPLVTISTAVVDSSAVKGIEGFNGTGKFVELVFKDNGIGFEQQYADKIFTVFQRLHGKQEYPGTGIGLALCKKIIHNHKGQVAVTSIPDEGTTFMIYFPANLLVAADEVAQP
jgi:PAS domain S-box-containing protein